MQEQPLCRVTLPAARAIERGDEPGCIELVEAGDRPGLLVHRVNAIDPPLLAAGAEVELAVPVVGNPFGVLDDGAIHVGDPECSVGTGLEHGGPEPVVARGEELAIGLVRPAMAAEGRAVGLEHHPMHQVVDRLADEQASGELGSEEVVAIGRRAVGGGDAVGRVGVVEPGQRRG